MKTSVMDSVFLLFNELCAEGFDRIYINYIAYPFEIQVKSADFSRFRRTHVFLYFLPFLHPLPVDEAVGVVEEEHRKAEDHRNVRRVFDGGEDP